MSTLRRLRQHKGWTLQQVADQLSADVGTISRGERGSHVSATLLKPWLGVLDASPADVVRAMSECYGFDAEMLLLLLQEDTLPEEV